MTVMAKRAFISNIFRCVICNRLVSNYTLLLPNKGAKSRLRGIKQKENTNYSPEPRLGSFVEDQ